MKVIYIVAALVILGLGILVMTSGGFQKSTGKSMEFTELCIQLHPEEEVNCRKILDLRLSGNAQTVIGPGTFWVKDNGELVFTLPIIPTPPAQPHFAYPKPKF